MAQMSVASSQPQTTPPNAPQTGPAGRPAPLGLVETPRCSLCGEPLDPKATYKMVSPFLAKPVSVCHTCHRAALGEGYRPQA